MTPRGSRAWPRPSSRGRGRVARSPRRARSTLRVLSLSVVIALGIGACQTEPTDETADGREPTATSRRTTSTTRAPVERQEILCPSGSLDFTHDSFEYEPGPYVGEAFSAWEVRATGTVTNQARVPALVFLSAEVESVGGLRADAAVLLYTADGNSAGSQLEPREQFVYSVYAPAIAFQRFGEFVKDDEPARVLIDASRSLWIAPPQCPVQTRGL